MCNENLDLVQLLGNCYKGATLYSPIVGEVVFEEIDRYDEYPVKCKYANDEIISFTSEGHYYSRKDMEVEGECLLFPSKDNRDWSTFCVYEDGDFLANDDGRAFIFRGKLNEHGYPMAYGGVDTCNEFIESEDNRVWCSHPFRKATPTEVTNMMNKMKKAGYIWDTNKKELKMDLPIDTLVAVGDKYSRNLYIHELAIRRYAGNSKCYTNENGSQCNNGNISAWGYIIPLNKLAVNVDGTINLENVTNYGTYNHNC